MRLAAISVDLDSLPHYLHIQGLTSEAERLTDAQRGLVGQVAVPRLLELLSGVGVPGTFFVIGRELETPGLVEALRLVLRQGGELANHSWSHDYALTRKSPAEMAQELARGEQALEHALGQKPVGFRAPGYTMTAELMQALDARGYHYDSSAFPAAPYYLLKASVMSVLSVLGRPSRAILDRPRVLTAPLDPYRPDLDEPYRKRSPGHPRAGSLIEFPLTVERRTRVPFFGTLVTSLPWVAVEAMFRAVGGVELFNFHLHALDVLDQTDGMPPALVAQQRDLSVPVKQKLDRLRRVFSWLSADREAVTLADAAGRYRVLV